MSETAEEFAARTIDEAIREGAAIYRDHQRRCRDDEVFKALGHQAKYEYYMKSNIDFARQYPIILRHIASFGMFHPKAVSMYIKKCHASPIKTDEDFAERQADYVKYLYMSLGNHMPRDQLNGVWRKTKEHVLAEMKAGRAKNDASKKRRTSAAPTNIQSRRDRLKWIAKTQVAHNNSKGGQVPP
jgi:hypothetical protein